MVWCCLRLEDNFELDYLPEAWGVEGFGGVSFDSSSQGVCTARDNDGVEGGCKVSIRGNERLVLNIMSSGEMAVARMVCECNCGNDIDIRRGKVGASNSATCSTSITRNTKKCHDCNVQVFRKSMISSSNYYS